MLLFLGLLLTIIKHSSTLVLMHFNDLAFKMYIFQMTFEIKMYNI